MTQEQGQEKRGRGRPRKWESDAQRMAVKRIGERQVDLELRSVLSLLRRGYLIAPDTEGRETDEQTLKRLRLYIEQNGKPQFDIYDYLPDENNNGKVTEL